MLIDTHAHVYHRKFESDVDAVIHRAKDAGVEIIIMPAIDIPSIGQAINLSKKYSGLYVMSALHPSDVKDATDADFQKVVDYCDEEEVIAIGESGLDYYWDRTFDDKQHDFFRRHIRLAADKDLPLILHNRKSDDDLVRILAEEKASLGQPDKLRGIFHCFGGSVDFARRAIQLGFILGIGGTVTFKNSGVGETLQTIGLDHVVLETDAPFLAPEPFRGKRNEPAYIAYVADKIASLFEVDREIVEDKTTANARSMFGI